MVATCLANCRNSSLASPVSASNIFWCSLQVAHPRSTRNGSTKNARSNANSILCGRVLARLLKVGSFPKSSLRSPNRFLASLIFFLLASCIDLSLRLLPREAGCTWPPLLCIQRGIGCTYLHSRCSDSELSRTAIHQLRSQHRCHASSGRARSCPC